MFKSYNELIKFAKSQNREKGKSVYFEEHHILPRFMGGTNDKSNLILLTLYEHIQAHYLLAIENENDSKIYNGNINSAWMVSHGKSKFSENKRKEIEKLLDNPELIKIIEDLKIRLKNIKHPERKGFDPFYKHKRIWVYYKNQKPALILEKNKNSKTFSKYQIMENCPICKNPNSEKSFACCEEHKTLYLQQIKEKNSIRQKEVTTIFKYTPNGVTSPVKHIPDFPLSTIELRFLAAILQDHRITMFMNNETEKSLKSELEGVVPLWTSEDVKYFDQNKDADAFENTEYIERFQTLLNAINNKNSIRLVYGRKENSDIFTPTHMI